MKKFECVYVPIGVPTFHLESAEKEFEKSIELIQKYDSDVVVPNKMLLTLPDLKEFIEGLNPDLVILQNITFANAAYATEVLKQFDAPILLWTLREPVIDGGRLRLNSLTGAYSAANAFKAMRSDELQYIFGATEDDFVEKKVAATIAAAKIKNQLRGLNIAAIGDTPQGFGFGRALDLDVANTFGANLESIEARQLMNKAKSLTDEEVTADLDLVQKKLVGLDKTPEKNKMDFIKLYKAYKDYIKENNISAISSRCWPDYFTEYGTPVCGVLALLNDDLIAASCESDVYGAISMYIGSYLSDTPTFFGDPVSLDEGENTLTFWHCGTAACSLARDGKAEVGVHPNRKIGPTMEFGARPSEVATVFRVGRKPNGEFRFFISSGEILDKPKQFLGTSLVFKAESNITELVTNSVKDGWEPHYAVIYADCADELTILGEMLGIEVCKY